MATFVAARQAQKRSITRAQRHRLHKILRFWHMARSQVAKIAKIARDDKEKRKIERRERRELPSMIRLWKADRLLTFDADPNVYVKCRGCESGRLWHIRRTRHGCEDCIAQNCPL